ncbi:MAG: hypothetical protein BroJett011_39430 [Chloroflexota bacterium]|nr:MAG: hypothetical protein BroJett011_39430 [Chloroflexota bacterium]
MKRKGPKKMLSTQRIALYLSLNVQVQRDNQAAEMLTIPLLPLTALLLWGWQMEMAIYRWVRQGSDLVNRVEQSLRTGALVSVIGLKAVLYGLGVAG